MSVLEVVVRVGCEVCRGAKRVRRYAKDDPNGETIDCAGCRGRGTVESTVTLFQLSEMLKGSAVTVKGKR